MVILTLNYVLHLIKQETQEMLLQDSSKVSNSRGFIIWVLFNVTISLGDRKIMITLFAHSGDIVYWQTEEKYRLYENTLEERVNTCDSILKQLRLMIHWTCLKNYSPCTQSVATKTKTLHDACGQLGACLYSHSDHFIMFVEKLGATFVQSWANS